MIAFLSRIVIKYSRRTNTFSVRLLNENKEGGFSLSQKVRCHAMRREAEMVRRVVWWRMSGLWGGEVRVCRTTGVPDGVCSREVLSW